MSAWAVHGQCMGSAWAVNPSHHICKSPPLLNHARLAAIVPHPHPHTLPHIHTHYSITHQVAPTLPVTHPPRTLCSLVLGVRDEVEDQVTQRPTLLLETLHILEDGAQVVLGRGG
jgi:hypothetical protein